MYHCRYSPCVSVNVCSRARDRGMSAGNTKPARNVCCRTSDAGSPDMVFGFFDVEGDGGFPSPWESSCSEGSTAAGPYGCLVGAVVEDEEEDVSVGVEERRVFWETQHQLLQAALCRTSSLETRIRSATKEALAELKTAEIACDCSVPAGAPVGDCRKCVMTGVSGRLRNAGFDCAVCRTKWRISPEIASGEHSFLDVVDTSSSKEGQVIRVIIELNFRGEFEMARAGDEYGQLVRRLPEVFVGKAERLVAAIKVLCRATKACMKQNKMYMGPWRKHAYVQAKWLSPNLERTTSSGPSESAVFVTSSHDHEPTSSQMPKKKKKSMLTVNLLGRLPSLHCAAVQVG